jgi:ribosomal protein S13
MKGLIILLLALLGISISYAQELNCQVSVLVDAKVEVSSTEKEIIKQMEQSIFDLMNNTQWTKDKFKTEERIKCNIQIQIREIPSTGTYKGYIQVQSTRPSFNSSYNTILLNFEDENFAVSFSRNAVLVYAQNQYRDNLTSILAFYAYYMIGLDYDSFSLKGGTPYFIEAQSVVTNAQVGGAPGWKSSESGKRNRFYLVDNILQPVFDPMRECLYMYHRKGIDKLYEDKVAGKKAIYDALNKLTPLAATRPNAVNLLSFLFCKIPEFKNVFSDSELKEKQDLVALLKRLDSANSARYQEILD